MFGGVSAYLMAVNVKLNGTGSGIIRAAILRILTFFIGIWEELRPLRWYQLKKICFTSHPGWSPFFPGEIIFSIVLFEFGCNWINIFYIV